ncbi:hypothetical protein GCM10011584_22290 [Nocardioides phosphati]|uniref:Class F sortase n=1 Tax=Nocardioides phosphati TaxID=1867775 RepID=A0ABQ2NBJ7_9ACTN|nr:class F sortase [Nocardioides phosphati]GGO90463.1 hypothetical protein GCM10011584_22290 [Nocardioides phosphati]
MSTSLPRRHRLLTAGVAVCLAAGGATMAFGAGVSPQAAPGVTQAPAAVTAAPLPPSPPDQILIERLRLAAKVVELRAAADGRTLTLPPLRETGWDSTSVTPGEAGITVVTGYIARTSRQPGVLKGLGRLRDGDVVTVERKDRKRVHYRVTSVDYYAQGSFPADRVFPRTDRPELRLISTGGPLHHGDPLGNAVVTAVAER